MPAWWRPILTHGAVMLLVAVLLASRSGWGAADVVRVTLVGTALLVLLRALFSRAGPRVDGLREAGPVRVTRDEADWVGNRTLAVENAAGAWRVRASTGQRARLEAQGPNMAAPARVKGNPRKAGRRAAPLGAL